MASDAPVAPDFIQFLFSTKPEFDCYFEVGNKSQGKPERIGAVKLMLMAHSEVFREGLKREKEGFPVEDIHPDTFKGMLKYVYGHDTTSDLCFDEADNLLYVAEKYMMKMFKDKLAVRLMKLLNTENICSLLNNPACYRHLELNSAITEMLRFETDHVLASPQFLWMNAEGFLKILEQDGLAVPEIELWRAAIKWAKHIANSEDGQLVRQQLSGLTQHLRLYTFNEVEICEVIPSEVLTKDELSTVCLYRGSKEKTQDLNDFSNKTEPRKKLCSKAYKLHDELKMDKGLSSSCNSSADYNFTLLTKQHCIELLPLLCRSASRVSMSPVNWSYKVDCTTTIEKVANPKNPDNSSANEPPITVTFSEDVKYGVEFEIPLAVDGRNFTLLPDTKYTVKMKLNGDHQKYYRNDTSTHTNDHLSLAVVGVVGGNRWYYYFPSTKLQYRVTTEL